MNVKKNIYVDTHSIEIAMKILGEDYVLYSSDYPITPAEFGRKHGLKQINLKEKYYIKLL